MNSLLQELKKRRTELGLKQHDMLLRVGVSRQQYQRLESKGNPRLDTLELIAKGLKSELMLIPQEKLNAVRAVLATDTQALMMGSRDELSSVETKNTATKEENALVNDPWRYLLEGEE